MYSEFTVALSVVIYIAILFVIAFYVEKKITAKSKLINNSIIYSLSLAVYCTAWTFYGSVGKAANTGLLFLTIYIGPTLMATVWWVVMRKLVRIKNKYRITSIVDFISARYDKSTFLGLFCATMVLAATIPYIALQLKAIIKTYTLVTNKSLIPGELLTLSEGWILVAIMSVFTIIFGIRKLDPTERHPGIIVVLAIECIVKLVAFSSVGIYVCYVLNDGFFDIINKMPDVVPDSYSFMGNNGEDSFGTWFTFLILSSSAIIFLPRQFHVGVIENSNEEHIRTSSWLFPIYLLAINIFVLPISLGGLIAGKSLTNADSFVLLITQESQMNILSLVTFIGGFSAATGMIMISTMTISTILTNHFYIPIINTLRAPQFFFKNLLFAKRVFALILLSLSYVYMALIGSKYALVSMGMISFAGALQLATPILGSLFWKKGNKTGAMMGLFLGYGVWFYTLYLPSFMKSDIISDSILKNGLFNISFFKPEELFGLTGVSPLTNAVFWSLFFNIAGYIFGSTFFIRSKTEDLTADDFLTPLDIEASFSTKMSTENDKFILDDKLDILKICLAKFFDQNEITKIITIILSQLNLEKRERINILELSQLIEESERVLAGSIGAAMAHQIIKSSDLMSKDERSELYHYFSDSLAALSISPRELQTKVAFHEEKEKSMEVEFQKLEKVVNVRTTELQEKNDLLEVNINKIRSMQKQIIAQEKLVSLGTLASGIAHELRNPLNFITNGSSMIKGNLEELKEFNDAITTNDEINKHINKLQVASAIITRHGNRAEEMISKFLIHTRTGKSDATLANLKDIIEKHLSINQTILENKYEVKIKINTVLNEVPDCLLIIENMGRAISSIIENAFYELSKSSEILKREAELDITLRCDGKTYELIIRDNGQGISEEIQSEIFNPFFTTKPGKVGNGLGLSIANDIIIQHNGKIKLNTQVVEFTEFKIILPLNTVDYQRNVE